MSYTIFILFLCCVPSLRNLFPAYHFRVCFNHASDGTFFILIVDHFYFLRCLLCANTKGVSLKEKAQLPDFSETLCFHLTKKKGFASPAGEPGRGSDSPDCHSLPLPFKSLTKASYNKIKVVSYRNMIPLLWRRRRDSNPR